MTYQLLLLRKEIGLVIVEATAKKAIASSNKVHLHPLTSIFLYLDHPDLDAPVRGRYSPGGSLGPPGSPAGGLQYLQVRHIHILLEISSLFLYVMIYRIFGPAPFSFKNFTTADFYVEMNADISSFFTL